MSSSSTSWSEDSASDIQEVKAPEEPRPDTDGQKQLLPASPRHAERPPMVDRLTLPVSPRTPDAPPPDAPPPTAQVVFLTVETPPSSHGVAKDGSSSVPSKCSLPELIEQILSPMLSHSTSPSGSRSTERWVKGADGPRPGLDGPQCSSAESMLTSRGRRHTPRNRCKLSPRHCPLDDRPTVVVVRLQSPRLPSDDIPTASIRSRKRSPTPPGDRVLAATELSEFRCAKPPTTPSHRDIPNRHSSHNSLPSKKLEPREVLKPVPLHSSKSNLSHDEPPNEGPEDAYSPSEEIASDEPDLGASCLSTPPPLDDAPVKAGRSRRRHKDSNPDTAKNLKTRQRKKSHGPDDHHPNFKPEAKERSSTRNIQIGRARKILDRPSDLKKSPRSPRQAKLNSGYVHSSSSVHVVKRTVMVAHLTSATSVNSTEAVLQSPHSSCCESQVSSLERHEKPKRPYSAPHRRAEREKCRCRNGGRRNSFFQNVNNVHSPGRKDSHECSRDNDFSEEMFSDGSSVVSTTNIEVPVTTKKQHRGEIRKKYKQINKPHKPATFMAETDSSKSNLPLFQDCNEADEVSETSCQSRNDSQSEHRPPKRTDVDVNIPSSHYKRKAFPMSHSKSVTRPSFRNGRAPTFPCRTDFATRNKASESDASIEALGPVITCDAITQVDEKSSKSLVVVESHCPYCHKVNVMEHNFEVPFTTRSPSIACMPKFVTWQAIQCQRCKNSDSSCVSASEASSMPPGDGNIVECVSGGNCNAQIITPTSSIANDPLNPQENSSSENAVAIISGARVSKLNEPPNIIKVSLQRPKPEHSGSPCGQTWEHNKCSCLGEDNLCKSEVCLQTACSKLEVNENKVDHAPSLSKLPNEGIEAEVPANKYYLSTSLDASRHISHTNVSKAPPPSVDGLESKAVETTEELMPSCGNNHSNLKKERAEVPLPHKPEAGTNPKRNRFGWLIPDRFASKQRTGKVKAGDTVEKQDKSLEECEKRSMGYLRATLSSNGRQRITTDQNRERCHVVGAPSRYLLTSNLLNRNCRFKKDCGRGAGGSSLEKAHHLMKNNGNPAVAGKALSSKELSSSSGVQLPEGRHRSTSASEGQNHGVRFKLHPPCFSAQELAILSAGDAKFLHHSTKSEIELNGYESDLKSSSLKRAIESIRRLLPSWRKKSVETVTSKVSVASSNTHLLDLPSPKAQ